MTTIDPQLLFQAATKMANASNDIETNLTELDGKLAVSQSAGTHTSAGTAWASSYDQSASDVFELGSLTSTAARELGYAVHQAGLNHANAEASSNPGGAGEAPPARPTGTGMTSSMHPSEISAGGLGDLPEHWNLVADMVTRDWPDCDTGKISEAASALKTFGTEMTESGPKFRSDVVGLFAGIETPELSGILDEVNNVSMAYSEAGNISGYLSTAADRVSSVSKSDREVVKYMLDCLDISIRALESTKYPLMTRPGGGLAIRMINQVIEGLKRKAASDFDDLMDELDGIVAEVCSSNEGNYAMASSVSQFLGSILDRTPRQTDPVRNRQGQQNTDAGAEGERRAGIDPDDPKRTVDVNGRYRIPDQIDDVNEQITEVKNKNAISSEDDLQISDTADWAEENGYTATIVVDHRTKLSPAVEEMIEDGRVTIIRKELDDNNDL